MNGTNIQLSSIQASLFHKVLTSPKNHQSGTNRLSTLSGRPNESDSLIIILLIYGFFSSIF